jgi:hypothetical protein
MRAAASVCVWLCACGALAAAQSSAPAPAPEAADAARARPVLTLRAGAAALAVDLGGGSLASLTLDDASANPLSWDSLVGSNASSLAPRPRGAFVAVDRWGPASWAETQNGMPWHGEASAQTWEVLAARREASATAPACLATATPLPLARMQLRRSIAFGAAEGGAAAAICDAVNNEAPLGRAYNLVQHPTIAPTFLSPATRVDSSAAAGARCFTQPPAGVTPRCESPDPQACAAARRKRDGLPTPEEPAFSWPDALDEAGARAGDARFLAPNSTAAGAASLHGWVFSCLQRAPDARRLLWATATSAQLGLQLGFAWRERDYPWSHFWLHAQQAVGGYARAIEFGTTGLHAPFESLAEKGSIWGAPLMAWMDANATDARGHVMWLMRVPPDFRGVDDVALEAQQSGGSLLISEARAAQDGGQAGAAAPRQLRVRAPAGMSLDPDAACGQQASC